MWHQSVPAISWPLRRHWKFFLVSKIAIFAKKIHNILIFDKILFRGVSTLCVVGLSFHFLMYTRESMFWDGILRVWRYHRFRENKCIGRVKFISLFEVFDNTIIFSIKLSFSHFADSYSRVKTTIRGNPNQLPLPPFPKNFGKFRKIERNIVTPKTFSTLRVKTSGN